MTGERGSTIPLVLGFVIIALLVVAGSVAFSDAFVQQRQLQDACDGAATAAAAQALDLRADLPHEAAPLADVDRAVGAYLARDPERRDVRIRSSVSGDGTILTLHCREERTVAFGALFGRHVLTHTATSSARAVLTR